MRNWGEPREINLGEKNDKFWGPTDDIRRLKRDHPTAFQMGLRGLTLEDDDLVHTLARGAERIDRKGVEITADLRLRKRQIENQALQLAQRKPLWDRFLPAKPEVDPGEAPQAEKKQGFFSGLLKQASDALARRRKSAESPDDDWTAYRPTEDEDLIDEADGPEARLDRDAAFAHVPFKPEVDKRTSNRIIQRNIQYQGQFSSLLLHLTAVVIGVGVFIASMVVDFFIISEFWKKSFSNEFLEVPQHLMSSVWSKSAQVIFAAFAIHFFLKMLSKVRVIGDFLIGAYIVLIFALTIFLLFGSGFINAAGGGVTDTLTELGAPTQNDEVLAALGLGETTAAEAQAPAAGAAAATVPQTFTLFGYTVPMDATFFFIATQSIIFIVVTSVGALCMQLAERHYASLMNSFVYQRRMKEYKTYEDAWATWYLAAANLERVENPDKRRNMMINFIMEEVAAYRAGLVRGSGWRVRLQWPFWSAGLDEEGRRQLSQASDGRTNVDRCRDAIDQWADLVGGYPQIAALEPLPRAERSDRRTNLSDRAGEEDTGQGSGLRVVHSKEDEGELPPPVSDLNMTQDDKI